MANLWRTNSYNNVFKNSQNIWNGLRPLLSQDFLHSSSRIYMTGKWNHRVSLNLDCSCTTNSIPANWPFHMIGSSKLPHLRVRTWHRLNPPLSCRPVHHDRSLNLHCQVSRRRVRGRLRPLLRLGLDRLRLQPPLSHHLPRPAEEEWVRDS